MTTPTSQGRCSTCAYFAGVAAVEGAWKLAGHPLVKLSEQEEIDCYNNGGYAMPNMVHGIARNVDAPLANHSDPNITGCRDITNCTHCEEDPFMWQDHRGHWHVIYHRTYTPYTHTPYTHTHTHTL